jgi:hypothetical protein
MGAMGDPFGLVQDESDFLIHPAKVAKVRGEVLRGLPLHLYRCDGLGL